MKDYLYWMNYVIFIRRLEMVECPVCGSLKIKASGQFYKCTNCRYVWRKSCPTCGGKRNDNTIKRH